jgi:hypothetical protein
MGVFITVDVRGSTRCSLMYADKGLYEDG